MPDRIVRAGILTSDPVNTLSWPAEVLYRRLFSIVDDYGRYDGRSSLLRAHLYPLKIDKVSEADVGKWLTECVTAGLVSLYRVEGRPYVEVLKFGARVRAESSKWPAREGTDTRPPASADICPQPRADAAVFVGVVEDVVDTPKAPKGADGRFDEFWSAYPNKVGKDAARKAFEKRKPGSDVLAQMLAAIDAQKAGAKWLKNDGEFIPNPATWLNQGRWMDGVAGDGSTDMAEWHETRGGVERRAAAMGMPKWDECSEWTFYKSPGGCRGQGSGMSDQTTLIRFAGTREQAHAAILAANDQAKLLVSLERRVKVTVEEAEDEITILQRAFLHKAVFPQVEEQYVHPDGTRTDWRAWKEYFRARFLGDRWVLKRVPRWDAKAGRMVLPRRKTPHRERVSTEGLGIKKYSAYIDLVIDTATVELGVQFRFITAERDAVRYVAPPRKAKQQQPEAATA